MAETKKELEALIEKLQKENEELKAAQAETLKKQAARDKSEMVSIFIPLVDGEEDAITVGCNGVMYKVKRGVQVEVPRKVAIILQNSSKQAVRAAEYSESVKKQELNA